MFNFDLGIDAWAHIGEMVVALPVLWKANRFMNKMLDERENFPPHRHLNGKIAYPKGLRPEPLEGTIGTEAYKVGDGIGDRSDKGQK